ncbi:hypothetical protein KHA94_04720 [Bacillus sp. FJAT-49705]|uniref:Uncharacterized protein n=1 Tax=Cytobacillus citreus TaxID=2833586 RepID=A0ABS5NPL7_9BACI|nr:hypothetical protein [Cytobacillus citreus]MBS4189516.1 hypothetical protein [Cytobacillus citreus]
MRKFPVLSMIAVALLFAITPNAYAEYPVNGYVEYKYQTWSKQFLHDSSFGYSTLRTSCDNKTDSTQVVTLEYNDNGTWRPMRTSKFSCILWKTDVIRWLHDSNGNILPTGYYRFHFTNNYGWGNSTTYSWYEVY